MVVKKILKNKIGTGKNMSGGNRFREIPVYKSSSNKNNPFKSNSEKKVITEKIIEKKIKEKEKIIKY